MKKKKLLTLIGSICLSLVLAALLLPACAPATPEEVSEEIAELEAKIDDLEGDVAAEKAKAKSLEGDVSDLEKEIAALKKPAQVEEWEPSTWQPAGACWDDLTIFCDYITRMSDGRIVATPSAPGAVCPIEGVQDAISAGTTEVMMTCPAYYSVPAFSGFICTMAYIPQTNEELSYLFDVFEDGRISQIMTEEYAKIGIQFVGNDYYLGESVFIGKKPSIYGVKDFDKKIVRAGDPLLAKTFEHYGASTTWIAVPELYTSMATGVIDCFFCGSPVSYVKMGFHEVTDYWIKKPALDGPAQNAVIANPDVWNGLPDDLKAIVQGAIHIATKKSICVDSIELVKAWKFVEDYGIEIVEWSDEDIAEFQKVRAELMVQNWTDPASQEIFDVMQRWQASLGR